MRPAIAVFLLLIVTALVYAPMRSAGFVYEDSNAVWQNASVIGGLPIAVNRARWLSELSHRVVFEVFGKSPAWPHLVNVGLHLLNGALVYQVALAVIAPWAAVFASGLFLLHPLQTESVAYVASRSELLSTLLSLVACWLAIDARRWWEHLGVWVCLAAAICAKESTVVMVPIIALMDLWRGRHVSWLRIGLLAGPALAMAVSVFLFDFTSKSELGVMAFAGTQAVAVWRYLALALVPIGQTVDHDFELIPLAVRYLALASLLLWCGMAVLASLSVVNGDNRRVGRMWDESRWLKPAVFGFAWMMIALAPRFVMRIPEVLNEHQTLLPFVGVWIMIAAVVVQKEEKLA